MKKNKRQPTWASSTLARELYVDALREGRKTRSTTERPSKGKGSYTRKQKHKNTKE